MQLGVVCLLLAGLVSAQTEAKKPLSRVAGEVSVVDAQAGSLTIKSDAGGTAKVNVAEQTKYLRVPEGEKDPQKWIKIALTDITAGDRVLARGSLGAEGNTITATTVLVMSKADVALKRQEERSDWQKRSVAGTVAGLDTASKEVTISVRSREGPKPMLVDVSDKTTYLRYPPDSAKFADAKSSSWDALKIGDEIRVLGDKSEDGSHLHAEQILSGAFQTLAGTVISADPGSNTVKITDLQNKQPVTVTIKPDTLMRRLPAMMATMMAQRMRGGGTTEGSTGGTGATGAPGTGTSNRPVGSGAAGGGWQGGQAGPGGQVHGAGGNGNFDLQQTLQRLPALTLADLKPGDALIISSVKGTVPGNVTAIRMVAGVEPFLAAAPRNSAGQVNLGQWNMDMSVPGE